VWLADLDKVGDERFQDLSLSPKGTESQPAWSPDGSRLAWSSVEGGYHNLYVWDRLESRDAASGDVPAPRLAGSGDLPAWSPDAACC